MNYSFDFITELFVQLSHRHPFLALQWSYILKLLKHCKQALWAKLIAPKTSSLNSAVLRKGGVVLLCDHLCDHLGSPASASSSSVDTVTWLVVDHVAELMSNVGREGPVQEFIHAVHAHGAPTSGLLLQAVISR